MSTLLILHYLVVLTLVHEEYKHFRHFVIIITTIATSFSIHFRHGVFS